MLQQVMTNPGEITFREVPVPEVKDDQVLVKIRNIGICGSDIHVYHGKHPFTKYPVTQGHEVSGEIAEIGKNVSGFQIGQKVTIEPQVYCGHCYPCRHGKYNLCEELKVMGFQTTGTASEYFAVDASKVTPIPEDMSYEEGAMIEPLAVAVHGVKQMGDVKGMNITVIGAGPIGNLVAQTAKGMGAAKVMITDVSDLRLEKAKECGIDVCVNTLHKDFGEAMVEAFDPDKVILKDISLFAKPGQKLAFVGSTGAGKTTITNLINRFYDIQEGKIRYDGINITKIKKDDLRRSLGIVLQDTHLFTGTIRDNIRYGNLDATDEQIYEAARLAHADQFIRMLPNGYDTMLSGDGEELSQGQRQLLSIARAAVADPPVLILDEATSSIDTRTESIVQKGMDNLMKGRTVFVIAHRLSTIRNSDAIIVLDHGQIIERGDHADLIKQKGTYYQLYTGKLELS